LVARDEPRDMPWPKPPSCSKGAIDRAGAALILARGTDRDAAADIVNTWRSAHSFPLNTFQTNLRYRARRFDPNATVAQRLKRLSSIQAKIRREDRMKLSQMQDIGGARAIVKDVGSVSSLATLYALDNCKIRDDYILQPKNDGYRGIHLIGRYEARTAEHEIWNGYRIELQLRSRLQHTFSTAVETVTTFTGQPLKFGGGEADWRRFFALMGSVIARIEGTPLVPGTPPSGAVIVDEVRDLALRLRVRECLEAWTFALKRLPTKRVDRTKAYLLILDVEQRTIRALPFQSDDAASRQYLLFEKQIMNEGKSLDVVQVAAKSVHELRRAYPNYYSDTRAFLRVLRDAAGV
jgi:hypothetical protein